MRKRFWHSFVILLALLGVLGLLAACAAEPEEPAPPEDPADPAEPTEIDPDDPDSFDAEEYFSGKTIRAVIPYAPGGTASVIVPFVAHELSEFIPGNPRIVSTNMPPVVTAHNFLYQQEGDGLHFMYLASPSIPTMYLPEANYDLREFHYFGNYTSGDSMFFGSGDIPYDHLLDPAARGSDYTLRIPVTPDPTDMSENDLASLLLADELGIPMRAVPLSGAAAGTPELLAAFERGDLDGMARGGVYYTLHELRSGWLRDGFAKPIAHYGRPGQEMRPSPELDMIVPNMTDWVLSEGSDELIGRWEAFLLPSFSIGRHWALPPDTPDHIVQVYRNAFAEAMQEEAFVRVLERLLGDESEWFPDEQLQEILVDSVNAFDARQAEYEQLTQDLFDRYTQR